MIFAVSSSFLRIELRNCVLDVEKLVRQYGGNEKFPDTFPGVRGSEDDFTDKRGRGIQTGVTGFLKGNAPCRPDEKELTKWVLPDKEGACCGKDDIPDELGGIGMTAVEVG
jgi:hypothetical protein